MITNHDTFTTPESAFYEYQSKMEKQNCQVCNNQAAGFHHGAFVCEACKKFFKRYSLNNIKNNIICREKCEFDKVGRRKCSDCRFQKCLQIGMKMMDIKSNKSLIDISKIPCRVCGGKSSGFHFGSLTCEGCKGFFRRTLPGKDRFVCITGKQNCVIQSSNRIMCKFCRYQRCLSVGMSRMSSRIGRQPNAVKYQCAVEISRHAAAASNNNSQYPTTITTISTDATSSTTSSCSSTKSLIIPQPPHTSPHYLSNQNPSIYCPPSTITNHTTTFVSCALSVSNHFPKIIQQYMDESLLSLYHCVIDAVDILHLPMSEAQRRLQQATHPTTSIDLPCATTSNMLTTQQVWQSMMHNFDTHAHLLVSFAKCLPSFCQLPLPDRRLLVQESMYRVVLLNLARYHTIKHHFHDYQHYKDQWNYFDFAPHEYEIIVSHFPLIEQIMSHVIHLTITIKQLQITPLQLGILCCIQLFANSDSLECSEMIHERYHQCIRLFWMTILDELIESDHPTTTTANTTHHQHNDQTIHDNVISSEQPPTSCLTFLHQLNCPSDLLAPISSRIYPHNLDHHRHRLTTLIQYIPDCLNTFNMEHHNIISQFKQNRADLEFPELYIEMFQLNEN